MEENVQTKSSEKKPAFTVKRVLKVLWLLCIVFVFCPSFLVSCSGTTVNVNVLNTAIGISVYGGQATDPHPIIQITRIKECTFGDCSSLTELTIPAGVTSIEDSAFISCDALENVNYLGNQDMWDNISIADSNTKLQDATLTTGNCAHSYTTSVVAPGCQTAGYTLHFCSLCGYSYKDNETADGTHQLSYEQVSTGRHRVYYLKCDYEEVEICTDKNMDGICDVCKSKMASLEAGGLYDDVLELYGWRYEAIKYTKEHGIMNGISGTHNFAPDEPLTRAMFATIIYRMEGSPKASYSAKFPDVPDGNYFSVPIIWANKAGIINGHSNTGLFGTRENITREDMVVIMYRYCRVKGLASGGRADLSRFPDAKIICGDWAAEISGTEDINAVLSDWRIEVTSEITGNISAQIIDNEASNKCDWNTVAATVEDAKTLDFSLDNTGMNLDSDNLQNAEVAAGTYEEVKSEEINTDEESVKIGFEEDQGDKKLEIKENPSVPEPDVDKSSWLYDDVPEKTGWRYDAIKYVKDHGIMNGISGTHNFAPDEPLTRAMFATIIYRMEGSPKASYSAKFPDVPDGNYFSVPIIWANKAGIINGHSNTGLFGTRENITREDMVVIMYRYCRVKGLASGSRADLSRFPDADQIFGYAKEAVQWAVANGIINGRSNTGMLDPKGNASRVETAAIIQRFMTKIK